MKPTLALRSFLLGSLFLSAAPAAFAATFTWDGGGADSNWSTAGNWTGAAPTTLANNDFIFGALASPFQTTANQDVVGTNTNLASLSFSAALLHSINITGLNFQFGTAAGRTGPVNNSDLTQTITAQSSVFSGVSFTGANGALNVNELSFRRDTTPAGYALILNGAVGGTVTTQNITSGEASIYALTKQDAGKWTIVSSATYGGATTISGGTLEFQNSVASSGIANAGALIFNNAGAVSYANAITGAGFLTKQGAGTLTLGGTNTYTGATTVSAGTLLVNGSISTTILTTVASGATIGGSGTVGALTVSSGGFINPGNSPGILNSGNYTQAGLYTAEINGTTPGTQHDQINVTGTVNITSGSLATMFSGSYSANDLIFILLNDSTDAITGTYTGLAQGAVAATYGGFDWVISYDANNTGVGTGTFNGGNDIALRAIPEPSSALLGAIGLLALLRRRR